MGKRLLLCSIIHACQVTPPNYANPSSSYGSGTGSNPADEYVGGYYRSNGTYVSPYHRTVSNNSTSDNYSTSLNYNPYTGKTGATLPKAFSPRGFCSYL